MKPPRLDQILLQLGYTTEDQIASALQRQRDHGGRFGSHLVDIGFITDAQLTEALAKQHGIAGYDPARHAVDEHILDRAPANRLREWQLVPLRVDEKRKALHIVIADPDNYEAVHDVRELFGVVRVELVVAPERVIADLLDAHYGPEDSGSIELPELFEPGLDSLITSEQGDETRTNPDVPVLMICRDENLENALSGIFRSDGYELHCCSDAQKLTEALRTVNFQHVLVAEEMYDEFIAWSHDGCLRDLRVPFEVFSSVSRALLDNPVPYKRTVGSLLRTLHIIASARTSRLDWKPPYTLICKDVRAMAEAYGLSLLAVDGLQLAAYLLVPDPAASDEGFPASDFERSVQYASTIRFPWAVDQALEMFEGFHTGAATAEPADIASELNCATQILALAWYRHVVVRASKIRGEEGRARFKSAMRQLAGRVATSVMIERYISLIEERGDAIDSGHQILIVARTNEWMRQFSIRFSRSGIRTLWTDELADAQKLCERQSPTVVLIDYDDYAENMDEFCQTVKLAPRVLLYAIASNLHPSLILDLLESGVDDVIAAPHDYDVIAARIERAIRGLVSREDANRGGFDASFEVFSFLDLVQSLAQSRKSVRVDLANDEGDGAVVYMCHGRITHAECGDAVGEPAIHRVIAWEQKGSFSVIPTDQFPEPNVSKSTESILMEGCRLLDESRV